MLFVPTLLVVGAPQLALPTLDSASFAFGLAVALPFSSTGFGLTLGARVGAVASRLIVTGWLFAPPALVAVHVKVMLFVSLVTVVVSQPVCELIVDSASTTLQLTVTSLVYQPLLPRVPATLGVMIGAVVSEAAGTSTRLCSPLAAMAMTPVSPLGTFVWPSLLSPQATTVPSFLSARLW